MLDIDQIFSNNQAIVNIFGITGGMGVGHNISSDGGPLHKMFEIPFLSSHSLFIS